MNDTPQHIRNKQMEIMLSKTEGERLEMGIKMMQAGYDLVKERAIREHPNANKKEISYLIFEALYGNDFSNTQKKRIKKAMNISG